MVLLALKPNLAIFHPDFFSSLIKFHQTQIVSFFQIFDEFHISSCSRTEALPSPIKSCDCVLLIRKSLLNSRNNHSWNINNCRRGWILKKFSEHEMMNIEWLMCEILQQHGLLCLISTATSTVHWYCFVWLLAVMLLLPTDTTNNKHQCSTFVAKLASLLQPPVIAILISQATQSASMDLTGCCYISRFYVFVVLWLCVWVEWFCTYPLLSGHLPEHEITGHDWNTN